ncbi:hypothetical protein [Vibrio mangrovi]|uniref:Uncharacterized protein n=1 Tax=Vibrio mangrovi TaxID=474394 RepID=A0A1Y6IZD8_9VIBR|nr:hypothetical protein [Vibrio mangrovi]MDW6002323.1 hypothetical protein [Vibrio mangrovi]SMS03035.1 hypothetical protein VIM7927_04398 [Vibrio mangrovi]
MNFRDQETLILEHYMPGFTHLSEEEADQYWFEASPQTVYQTNMALQKLRGKGKNFLSMFEASRADICDFPDLLCYDIPYWEYQKHCIESWDNPDPEKTNRLRILMNIPCFHREIPAGYSCTFNDEWIRLFMNGQMVYGSLYSASHYILSKIEEAVNSWIEQCYPHQVQMDVHLDRSDDNCIQVSFDSNHIFNYQQTHKAKKECRRLYSALSEKLEQELNRQIPATYLIEFIDSDGSPQADFVFKNNQTLSLVCPVRFLEDFTRLTQSNHQLDFLVNRYVKQITSQLIELGF